MCQISLHNSKSFKYMLGRGSSYGTPLYNKYNSTVIISSLTCIITKQFLLGVFYFPKSVGGSQSSLLWWTYFLFQFLNSRFTFTKDFERVKYWTDWVLFLCVRHHSLLSLGQGDNLFQPYENYWHRHHDFHHLQPLNHDADHHHLRGSPYNNGTHLKVYQRLMSQTN